MNVPSIFKLIRGIVLLRGGSDSSIIGNTGDSIHAKVTSSALPTGAATEVKQDTGNTSLGSIDTKLTDIETNQIDGTQISKIKGDTDGELIGNNFDRLLVDSYITESDITRADALAMIRSSGLQEGEFYDRLNIAVTSRTSLAIQYDLSEICQFQVELITNGIEDYTISKRVCEFFLLQEDNTHLLQETGDGIKTQGLVP